MELTDWLWANEAPSRNAQKHVRATLKGLGFWQPDLSVGVGRFKQLQFVIISRYDPDTCP